MNAVTTILLKAMYGFEQVMADPIISAPLLTELAHTQTPRHTHTHTSIELKHARTHHTHSDQLTGCICKDVLLSTIVALALSWIWFLKDGDSMCKKTSVGYN